MTRSLVVNPRRRIYRFLLLVTLFWIVSLLVWNLISPLYGSALARVTGFAFHMNPLIDCEVSYRFEKISIIAHTYFSIRVAPDGRKEYYEGNPSWDSRRFHFSFTVWMALLLATPFDGRWKRKILWFLVGWAIIFVTQIVGLFLQTIYQNMLFVRTLMPSGKYLEPAAMELILAFAGRYFLLIGSVLFPLLVWLPIGVSRLKIVSTEGGQRATLPPSGRLPM
jgi:hypothetical protein